MKETKIVVIGAGMAGVTASVYLKRANKDFVLIDANGVGGKLNTLSFIENYPTATKITGPELAKQLENKIAELGISCLKENVQTILKGTKGFTVVTDFDSYECEKVILAIGNGFPTQEIVNESKFIGQGVSYCAVCDGSFYKGLDVAVIGNNTIAIEETIYLAGIVNKVYLISKEKLCGGDLENKMIKSLNGVEIIEGAEIQEIIGDVFGVTGIRVNNKVINVAGVFPYIGKKTTSQILSNLKPAMNGNFVIADENMETNIKGLYVAGDIVDKKIRQLVTAANDGAIAAINASK